MNKIRSAKKDHAEKPVGNDKDKEAITLGSDSALVNELSGAFCDADVSFMTARISGYSSEMVDMTQENLEPGARAKELDVWTEVPAPTANFDFLKEQIQPVYSREQIATRVQQLAKEISRDYAARLRPLVVLGVLNGCSPFLTDLLRAISDTLPMQVDFVRASFYGNETVPTPNAWFYEHCHLPLEGKDILVVDDILDTGNTMNSVIERLYEMQPYRIKGCVCVEKRREHRIRVPEIKYRGFEIGEGWVVGYGMDYQQYFRNLPYIGMMNQDLNLEEQ